ncbi:MAG: hypothetical protein ACE5KM_03630, partial [Planctomycetaceae bacterium]
MTGLFATVVAIPRRFRTTGTHPAFNARNLPSVARAREGWLVACSRRRGDGATGDASGDASATVSRLLPGRGMERRRTPSGDCDRTVTP